MAIRQNSVPAGDGGRIKENAQGGGIDGLPYDVDPSETIYSGMTKRLARSDGSFVPMKRKPTE